MQLFASRSLVRRHGASFNQVLTEAQRREIAQELSSGNQFIACPSFDCDRCCIQEVDWRNAVLWTTCRSAQYHSRLNRIQAHTKCNLRSGEVTLAYRTCRFVSHAHAQSSVRGKLAFRKDRCPSHQGKRLQREERPLKSTWPIPESLV